MTRIRNAVLLGITGLGTAGAIALGPASMAQAADVPVTPAGTSLAQPPEAPVPPAVTPPIAATAPAGVSQKQTTVDGALQPNGYYCGPAATRIALSAHGTPPTFDALADDLGTTKAGTQSI